MDIAEKLERVIAYETPWSELLQQALDEIVSLRARLSAVAEKPQIGETGPLLDRQPIP